MSSSLRDIPGAGKPGRRSRRDPLGPRKKDGGMLRPAQPQALIGGNRRRKRAFGPRTERDPFNLILGLCFVVLALVGGLWLWNTNKVSISASGVEEGATLSPQETVGLNVSVAVSPTSRLDVATLTFDGEEDSDLAIVESTDNGWDVTAPPGEGFPEGEHTIEVRVPRSVTGTASWDLTFEVASP